MRCSNPTQSFFWLEVMLQLREREPRLADEAQEEAQEISRRLARKGGRQGMIFSVREKTQRGRERMVKERVKGRGAKKGWDLG